MRTCSEVVIQENREKEGTDYSYSFSIVHEAVITIDLDEFKICV